MVGFHEGLAMVDVLFLEDVIVEWSVD